MQVDKGIIKFREVIIESIDDKIEEWSYKPTIAEPLIELREKVKGMITKEGIIRECARVSKWLREDRYKERFNNKNN